MTPVITLKNVSVDYASRHALQNVSGTFHKGSLTAVAGPNGSGKSTLLKVIAGVIPPTAGEIIFPHGQKPFIAYLPQAAHMQRDFPMTVEEVVITGFYPKTGEAVKIGRDQRKIAHAALQNVGLAGYEDRQIGELSGGEFQRALFARVIVQDAPVVLLDEPFTAIDAETTARLIRLLLTWHKEGRTVICVLHDLLLIKKYFPESMVLQGKCLGSGHTHQMFEQKLLSFDLDMVEMVPPDELHDYDETHHHDH
jgi:zinc/manganese transport system ATP-binding protein